MKLLSTIARLPQRLLRTALALRQCWIRGGYTKVALSSTSRGSTLNGKNILVTGGSAGIGLAIARKCIAEGARVIITGRDTDRLNDALQSLNSPHATSLVWDISDISIAEGKMLECESIFGCKVDILVNNAGILGGYREINDLSEERWDLIINTNLKGLVFLTKYMVNRWTSSRHPGKIINISSMRGMLGVKDGPYGISKWGLNGLTEGLGKTLAPRGIIVNGIAPGIINTDSISISGIDSNKNVFLEGIPIRRIGLPEEIAELAVFLMSDSANYIVGQTIVCDGGYTLRV